MFKLVSKTKLEMVEAIVKTDCDVIMDNLNLINNLLTDEQKESVTPYMKAICRRLGDIEFNTWKSKF